MTLVADLHVHTTASDGDLTLSTLPAAARAAGLSAVAVTDHDRLHPELSTPVTIRNGITIIRGLELRVEATERLDLLAYGVDPTPELLAELDRLQQNRLERGMAIIEHVESYLDISLSIDRAVGLGRPHIAQAIADHPDTPYDADGAFEHLIGTDGPCYVERTVPTFDRGLALLRESAPIVALAHPCRYDSREAVRSVAPALDAIERWYPYDQPVATAWLEQVLSVHELLPTGGSDAHGSTLGAAGMDADAYERLASSLPIP